MAAKLQTCTMQSDCCAPIPICDCYETGYGDGVRGEIKPNPYQSLAHRKAWAYGVHKGSEGMIETAGQEMLVRVSGIPYKVTAGEING